MNLPLFRGSSSDRFSRFVERCNLDFKTYEPGEIVMKPEGCVKTLKCLVSGRLEITHFLFNGRVKVLEETGPGRFLGAERLFGLNNHIHYKAVAKSRCGTMEVDKQQYLQLVADNQVFLINLLNYLSRPMQLLQDKLCDMPSLSLAGAIASILVITTTRDSENIRIISEGTSLAAILTDGHQDMAEKFKLLQNCGYIKVEADDRIVISDRKRLIELVGE